MTFESAVAADAGMIVDRAPQTPVGLPEGLVLVSADNHIELTEDIFFESFPESLRAGAPRVWFDKYWRVGFPDAMQAYPTGVDVDTGGCDLVALDDDATAVDRLEEVDAAQQRRLA